MQQVSPQQTHIENIHQEYTKPSRLLQSFTNLSNSVIQTALSGQTKFVFEILQNADDAFVDPSQDIEVKFVLFGDYFIVLHNGKGFDYNDVERICDYASQIEEVKAHDLRKTGYKGLGFKSLFNLSDTIYIHSNGYSFRFDKTYWSDWQNKPWQVIPIWCKEEELPFYPNYRYDWPVNIILRVGNAINLENQLKELINQPEMLLFMHRINKLDITINDEICLYREKQHHDPFVLTKFYKNEQLDSTWLLRTFTQPVPQEVKKSIRGASQFIYPDKIKNAKVVPVTFAIKCNETLEILLKIRGLCYCTLPTQLQLSLPYHVNSQFILNLDRTQLHENEWNEFLIEQLGSYQFLLLADIAGKNSIKNYVITFFVREIDHPLAAFCRAFLRSYYQVQGKISWLPSHHGSRLLKLGETWIDEINFFRQNFMNIRDHIVYPNLLDYDVLNCQNLTKAEAKRFNYELLFDVFESKYFPQLTKDSYIRFIKYLHDRLKTLNPTHKLANKLKCARLILAKDMSLITIKNSFLEENDNPIPNFLSLNPINNEFLPADDIDSVKDWFCNLGAKLLNPYQIFMESVGKWIETNTLKDHVTEKNHLEIINFLAKISTNHLKRRETEKLKEKLIIFTENKQFKVAKSCFLPDAAPIPELNEIISDSERISSSYGADLKEFFISVGVQEKLNPIEVMHRSIIEWITSNKISKKLTKNNYHSIIEYIASIYPSVELQLQDQEKSCLRSMLILTSENTFHKAQDSYFDNAVPMIEGLESIIPRYRIVPKENLSVAVVEFFKKIGVSVKIEPVEVIRKSILKWIYEDQIFNRINSHNHESILKYMCDNWNKICNKTNGLKPKQVEKLQECPIFTRNNSFRKAKDCFFPCQSDDEIPGIHSVILPNEMLSEEYDLKTMKYLFENLGVQSINFATISHKYCDHLNSCENVNWFFRKLQIYWKKYKTNLSRDSVLKVLHNKFHTSSCLLARNGKMYHTTDLYSFRFEAMQKIDANTVPLLYFKERLPEDLENWLGFKQELKPKCLIQLTNALNNNKKIGEKECADFFTTLLEQLKLKERSEIKKHQFSLFSQDKELKLAKDLYYFKDDVVCYLNSCYLKRIPGMSHELTLELADLCGVKILPYSYIIQPENEEIDDSLQKFYFERLPFIVFLEAKALIKNHNITHILKQLFDNLHSIKLKQCAKLYIKYPFGSPVPITFHDEHLTIYVVGKWTRKRSTIHPYLKKELGICSNINDIIDMSPEMEKEDWLDSLEREDVKMFYHIEEEILKLNRLKEISEIASVNEENLSECDYSEANSDEISSVSDNDSSICALTQSEDESTIDENEKVNMHETKQSVTENDIKIEVKVLIPKISEDIPKMIIEPSDSDVTDPSSSSDDKSVEDDSSSLSNLRVCVETKNSSEVSNEASTERKSSTVLVSDIWPLLQEVETSLQKNLLNKETLSSIIPKINPSTELPNASADVLKTVPWLSEKYVFTFLQNKYKNKYPNSRIEILEGSFHLRWQFNRIDIIWLNEKEDAELPYDIKIIENGEIMWLIEVKSTDLKRSNLFNVDQTEFEEKLDKVEIELPRHKDKYCVYQVFNLDNTSASICQELNSPLLYQVIKLNNNFDIE